MVDRAEFFRIADAIVAEGREPSQRTIRERLARGGSFSDIGPLFVECSALRGHRPRPRAEDLPQHFRDRLGTMAADIWADGLRNGMIAGQNERDELLEERNALRLALAEMTAMVGVLENLPKTLDRVPEPAGEAVTELPRRRKDTVAFWDRVMQEIADLMEDRLLKPTEIFRLLDDDTAREAPKWTDKKWGPGFLADRMRGRAREGRFFEEPKPGYFRSRSAVAQPTIAVEGSAALVATFPEPATMPNVALQPTEAVPQAAVRPSLRRLAKRLDDAFADETHPEEVIFSVCGMSMDELDARDAYLAEE